jgi:hypothetical protein
MAAKSFLVLVAAGVLAAAAAAASGAPSGTYAATITGQPAALNGRWQLEFGAKGSVHIIRNGTIVVVGTASPLAGGRLKLHDRSGQYACSRSEGDGVYRYTRAGRRLTFAAVSDHCVGRKLVLTTKPYLK